MRQPDLADRLHDTVRQHGAFLIEDDSAHDFGITAEPTGRFVRPSYAGPNPDAFADAARVIQEAVLANA